MATDPLDALRLPVVPVEPRPEFAQSLLRRITGAGAPAPAGAATVREAPAGAATVREAPDREAPAGAATVREAPAREAPAWEVTVRYFVRDLAPAVAFYTGQLGFTEELRAGAAFSMLYRGGLRLLLSVPGLPGAGRPMPDGALPGPGGWNRIALQVSDLPAAVAGLQAAGVRFRGEIVAGVGVRQVLVEDPSGNLIELFEPGAGYHERRGGQEG